jgi:hypothetical protein
MMVDMEHFMSYFVEKNYPDKISRKFMNIPKCNNFAQLLVPYTETSKFLSFI